MSPPPAWYHSSSPAPSVQRSAKRIVRDFVRGCLPEPAVRGKRIVVHSRQTLPKVSRHGLRSEFHGLFSEFHSVLGALAYAEAHESTGVRIDFRSPLYVERDDVERGPNWWTNFFQSAVANLGPPASVDGVDVDEVHLNRVLAKYGRHGGFSDIVQGSTPYFYPMTYGISRCALNQLLNAHVHVRQEIRDDVDRFTSSRFEPGAYVVGVHYRGTDATYNWTGALAHHRTTRVPYRAYADEVRRVLEAASPRTFQVFVATDEIECLDFMRREFGDRLVHFEQSPRVHADSQAIHLDRTLPVSNYEKGRSALVDCLVLAAAGYLVKGRSNLSDASLAFNPHLAYSFYPDVPFRQVDA
jgi:hypothetical protein